MYVRVCVSAVHYLLQMMAIATNETIHTPPTREPAIKESCCPSSDLYSSAEAHKCTLDSANKGGKNHFKHHIFLILRLWHVLI